ncbi:MAG: hypothetical protein ACR2HX_17475 [Pyrinomonadaceae bacterium]
MTAAITWPYVTRLRDAVVDPGDPYLIAWILWWDYHQTFRNPLDLFHANIFYPYRYTLAFSEHSYGIAILFFPLFALGLRPLTVHAVAMFFGFAVSGYGAFRLGRTLSGSSGVGWVAGIIFAFVPYRFNMMSQLAYLFSPWVPLLLEALVLFVRERSRKRAVWLGVAFFMSGLSTISWFTLTLLPFALSAAFLLTRYRLWRERAFWLRGATALAVAALALMPFMLPYYMVTKLYGFTRRIEDVKVESAWPLDWFRVERRNQLWNRFQTTFQAQSRFKLFPGLLPILLSLSAVMLVKPTERHIQRHADDDEIATRKTTLLWLDLFIILAFIGSILAIGFGGAPAFGLFNYVTSDRILFALVVACVARLCIAYPGVLRNGYSRNFIETMRSPRRSDAYWLGLLWVAIGFSYSLGWNFFFYRILYEIIPLFRGMRVVTRGAIIAYLGMAILAGLGTKRLAELVAQKWPCIRMKAVYVTACALLLFELKAAPLKFMRGDVFPDAVTLRLKNTSMRGGIVVLPAGADFNHRHILRAADHAKPLIVGTSGFITNEEYEIETLTREGPIRERLIDLMEAIPASYLVIQRDLIKPDRRLDYEVFLARTLATGRLRFVKSFEGHADLYAVTKTEPEAITEEPLSVGVSITEWGALIKDDPVQLLSHYRNWSQTLFRLHVAAFGAMPRYADFLMDARRLGRGVWPGLEGQEVQLERNLRNLIDEWTHRPHFTNLYGQLNDAEYLDRLLANAGISIEPAERAAMIEGFANNKETRATTLLKVVNDPRFVEKENPRSLVVLHFFGYLRRNPADPPDNDLRGMGHWILDLKRNHDPTRLSTAFSESIEYQRLKSSLAGSKK